MTTFQPYNPNYYNIASRMDRLKHTSLQRPHSTPRLSSTCRLPTSFAAADQQSINKLPPYRSSMKTISPNHYLNNDNTDKFTGRVSKNTGIRKYNQRQIRYVMTQNTPQDNAKAGPAVRPSIVSPMRIEYAQPYNFLRKLLPGRLYSRKDLYTMLK